MRSDLRYSRPLRTAQKLNGEPVDTHRFQQERVLLTGESVVLKRENGRYCLHAALLLLVRIVAKLTIALPADCNALLEECRASAAEFGIGQAIEFRPLPIDDSQFDAILSVGTIAQPEKRSTVINSNGWLARASSGARSLPGACDQANPIGALAAACLGTAEVFKRMFKLKGARGELLDGVSFSVFAYERTEDPGPTLPPIIDIDALLVGSGAIGNGIVYLACRLPLRGRMDVVDRDVFGDENMGTCLLLGDRQIGREKALFAADHLRRSIDSEGYHGDVADLAERLGRDLPFPKVIVNALDNIEARHEVQRLWPDLVLDGAIDETLAQVSRHPWPEDTACLMCLLPAPVKAEHAEALQARSTGLTETRVRDTESDIGQQDVNTAPPEKQEWLRARLGKKVCSVISEGVLKTLSDEAQGEGFTPSVPFVACMSACMVTSELVKHCLGWPTTLESRFQFDLFCGPNAGLMFGQGRRNTCICVERASVVKKLRVAHADAARRFGSPPARETA